MREIGLHRRYLAFGFTILVCVASSRCESRSQVSSVLVTRAIEPRLTGVVNWRPCAVALRPNHAVSEANCGFLRFQGPPGTDCDLESGNRDAAVRALVTKPRCADRAIHELDSIAAKDRTGAAWNDLAVAYYLRAQRTDTPLDILRAFDAAERAVVLAPQSREGRFNLALTQEALGLREQAVDSWRQVAASNESGWSSEAGRHLKQLTSVGPHKPESLPFVRSRLATALDHDDGRAAAVMISNWPIPSMQYAETLLFDWAIETDDDSVAAARALRYAQFIANEIARSTGDRYLLDATDCIATAMQARDLRKIRSLREGHRQFGEAQRAEREYRREASMLFTHAQRLLAYAGSPFQAGAQVGDAYSRIIHGDRADVSGSLLALETYARRHRYEYLYARVQALHAFILALSSHYLQALELYDSVAQHFEHLGTPEDRATVYSRRADVFLALGQNELAWREAFQPLRISASASISPRLKRSLFTEAALAATAVGYPRPALPYASTAVDMVTSELKTVASNENDAIRRLRYELASALDTRAAIHLKLGNATAALRDVDEAMALAQTSDIGRDFLLARLYETRGQALLTTRPAAAVHAFSEALRLTASVGRDSLAANLYAARAAAYSRAGNSADAIRDLRVAADLFASRPSEAVNAVKGRTAAFEYLVRMLVDANRYADAFSYAETAQALRSDSVPREGFELRGAIALDRLRSSIPSDTLLLEYFVLDDRTFVWRMTRDGADLLTLRVNRTDVARWKQALQAATADHDVGALDQGLFAPYAELINPCLSRASTAETIHKLIIVPDGPMAGLPFAALRNPQTRRFLIQDFSVAVAGSATQYVQSLLRDQQKPSLFPRVLLIADPDFNRRIDVAQTLARLPIAIEEARQIRQLYGPQATLLTGTRSTVNEFRAEARRSTVLHIAAHTIIDSQQPSRSFLLLAPSQTDSGVLYAGDLPREEFKNARLVVLSACISSVDSTVNSGFLSIGDSFTRAGATAVVGSLWATPDATTAILMTTFHRYYLEGQSAADALRSAQVNALQQANPALRSPITWGAFQVVGFASSPFKDISSRSTSATEQ